MAGTGQQGSGGDVDQGVEEGCWVGQRWFVMVIARRRQVSVGVGGGGGFQGRSRQRWEDGRGGGIDGEVGVAVGNDHGFGYEELPKMWKMDR